MTSAIETRTLLLEIGVEELPSSFVDAALQALPHLMTSKLAEARLAHGTVQSLGTARRLAVVVRDVATCQRDLDEDVTGPPETAAFKDGKPTRAAEAFATKLAIPVDKLVVLERNEAGKKPGRYVVGRRVEKGRPATELLGRALSDVCAAIPFKKSMRWGSGDATFGRPVHWLVVLFGNEVVDLHFAGARSSNTSRGHRFLSPETFTLANADAYVDALRPRHVLVNREERASTMMDRVARAAKDLGGTHDSDTSLIDENASLVEEPHIITGSFDSAFLALPAAVIRSVARGHQKYFCVQKSDDTLIPHYLCVANTANKPNVVAKGNDRVMRARLADARFFFEEDKKAKLEDRVEKLGGIVFHNRLGTVREKVTRVEKLSAKIAQELGVADAVRKDVARAAHLAKFNLVSLMVGEFPELQGHMGREYATHAGESASVANAIRDHYRPLGASDSVASDVVSAIVALADRIDSLAGCFAVGLSPTGAADPFALRRACIAILRTLLEWGGKDAAFARLSFIDLIRAAHGSFEGKKLDLNADATASKVEEFAAERLRGLLASETSGAVADAVLLGSASVVSYPVYAYLKARGLHDAVKSGAPWLESARTVAKRLLGISKSAQPKLWGERELAATAADKEKNGILIRDITLLSTRTEQLDSLARVEEALIACKTIAEDLEKVFTDTLVNDPADPLTPKRLELLSYGAQCLLRIADFSRLG